VTLGLRAQIYNNREQRSTRTYIRGVGDELTKEDLLVGVEGVDDEREQLVDLGLEGEGLGLRGHGGSFTGGGGGAREGNGLI
jgi:hypothetical protein